MHPELITKSDYVFSTIPEILKHLDDIDSNVSNAKSDLDSSFKANDLYLELCQEVAGHNHLERKKPSLFSIRFLAFLLLFIIVDIIIYGAPLFIKCASFFGFTYAPFRLQVRALGRYPMLSKIIKQHRNDSECNAQ